MSQRTAVNRHVRHALMGIEAGDDAVFQHDILAEVGAHESPVRRIQDIGSLAAVFQRHVHGTTEGDIVRSLCHNAQSLGIVVIGLMRSEQAVPHGEIGTVPGDQDTGICRSLLTLCGYIMGQLLHTHIGAADADAPGIIARA